MVQQTFSGIPDDPSPGDVIAAADADKVREFLLALVKDGTETTTGQTSNLLLDADDGNWELQGREVGTVKTWTPTISIGAGLTSTLEGSYTVVGNVCTAWFRCVMTGSSGDRTASDLTVDLPINADTSVDAVTASTQVGAGTAVGSGHIHDDSLGQSISCTVQLRTASLVMFHVTSGMEDAMAGNYSAVSNSGDVLSYSVTYPVASA